MSVVRAPSRRGYQAEIRPPITAPEPPAANAPDLATRLVDAAPPGIVALMRDLGHGRVEHLEVRGGVPHVGARTKLFRHYRPGRPDAAQLPRDLAPSSRPHPQQQKLLAHCRAVGEGVVARVEVADGLPVHWSDT